MDEYNKYNNHKYKNSKQTKNKVGFYVSLAICVTAIGLAVWSTYTSYSTYKEKQQEVTATATQANNAVTGVTVEETTTTTETSTTAETTATTVAETTTVETPSTTLSAVETMLQVPGSLIYPIEGANISKPYSQDAVYSKTMGDYRSHLGIDMECNNKSDVLAMADGLVSDIYDDERMGKVLIEDCGSFMIYYSGIDKPKVEVNDSVSKGDKLCKVGSIPSEKKDGKHIHVAVRVNGSYVDPLSVISNNE